MLNPQANAALWSNRNVFTGSADLGANVDRDTWLTPRYILNELGAFDLDPCASYENPYWICKAAMTVKEDGLRGQWHGRVFMNPPFSNTVPWLQKHAGHGLGISLVPASIESKVWRSHVWPRAKAILLLHGRTRFANPDGSQTTGRPLRPVALIAWSVTDASILRSCKLAGVLLEKWSQR